MAKLKAKLCTLLILATLCVACKYETSEEFYARREAPCRRFCVPHGGFFGVAHVYTGGFSNQDNMQCVCNDGTTITRPN